MSYHTFELLITGLSVAASATWMLRRWLVRSRLRAARAAAAGCSSCSDCGACSTSPAASATPREARITFVRRASR